MFSHLCMQTLLNKLLKGKYWLAYSSHYTYMVLYVKYATLFMSLKINERINKKHARA